MINILSLHMHHLYINKYIIDFEFNQCFFYNVILYNLFKYI